MPPQKTLNQKVEEFRQDLDQLTTQIDLLKREYDLFFAGARKRQPFEMRTDVERRLRKWRTSNIQKLELTFRLNTLQSKFSSMVDVWDKIFKRREFDPKAVSPYGPTQQQLAEAAQSERRERQEALERSRPQRPRPTEPEAPKPRNRESNMKGLFDQFVDAKRDMGENLGSLSYDKFRAQLERQVDQIRGRTNCKDVEFSVVRKQGKVSLTAKPKK